MSNQKKTLIVKGMTCSACSRAVERSLNKMEGVEEASVNLAAEKATFVFDPEAVSLEDIKGRIVKAGYQPMEPDLWISRGSRKRPLWIGRGFMWRCFLLCLLFIFLWGTWWVCLCRVF